MKEETIAAIATPPGVGGVAMIRISGPGAGGVLKRLFSYDGEYEHSKMVYGKVLDGATLVDTGFAVMFYAPRSYTGEDVAEIHCHGGVSGTAQVLDLVLKCGARIAQPGEFTRRAFLNGKMDLTQAEAVCDFIAAASDAGAKVSMRQMQGALKEEILTAQALLTDTLAEVEAAVEYPEEDLEPEITKNAVPLLKQLLGKIVKLRDSFERGNIAKEGLPVAIAGKPNVGKSSLLNALLGVDRAIVSDVPGTTRDTIEQSFSIGDIRVYLTDTAGIRRTEDAVEEKGVERSKNCIYQSKLVLFVLDATGKWDAEDQFVCEQLKEAQVEVLYVLNKIDASQRRSEKDVFGRLAADKQEIHAVSAKTGEGIDALKNDLYRFAVGDATAQETVMITNLRHKDLLSRAAAYLEDALCALRDGVDMDCVTIDLNAAWMALGEITGNTVGEDIIDRIFSKFCLGK